MIKTSFIKGFKCKILLAIFTTFIVFLSLVVVSAEDENTVISVGPSNQSVSAGETFNVDITCTPIQPVKAFEFRLSFNPSLVKANSVTEGGFFNNYTTFFNSGVIDNVAGTIVDVYGLVVGPGNVTEAGTLITVSFTALQNSGTSSISLNGVGVTDEGGYLPVGVVEGSVTVEGGIPGGGGGGGYFPPVFDDENNPPQTPLKPSGSTVIELGVEYVFESSTVDVDDDMIRFRFDWGDSNFSNWSNYVGSNELVSMSHSWTYVSSFDVMVIAQDENGLNSSWSLPLNVSVSQVVSGTNPPVAIIDFSGNISSNETIVFNASDSFDIDGVIVSYYWDFGDGEIGSGLQVSHVYKNPGEYIVTLVVTDNDGNTYSKSVFVNVASVIEEELGDNQFLFPFSLGLIFFGFAVVIFVCLLMFFRDNVKDFISNYLPSIKDIFQTKNKIYKIDAKIEKLKKNLKLSKKSVRVPPVKNNFYSYENLKGTNFDQGFIENLLSLNSEEKEISTAQDQTYFRDRVDEIIQRRLDASNNTVQWNDGGYDDVGIRSAIDKLVMSNTEKSVESFKQQDFSIDDTCVEKKVDDLFRSLS